MRDIRRQRHLAKLVQNFLEDTLVRELNQAVSLLHNVNNLSG